MAQDTEPYYVRIKRLREERHLSQPDLFRLVEGVSFSTLVSLEQDPARSRGKRNRARYPSTATLEAISAALKVPPEEFPEYRLAKAREQLDDRLVEGGLDEAMRNYERWIAATRTPRKATEVGRRVQRQQAQNSTPDEAANDREAS